MKFSTSLLTLAIVTLTSTCLLAQSPPPPPKPGLAPGTAHSVARVPGPNQAPLSPTTPIGSGPTEGVPNPDSNAYSGEWFLGPIAKSTFTDDESFKLNISDMGTSLTLTLADTSYRFDQVPGLPHVYKYTWSNKPIRTRVNTAVVIKLSDRELLHVKGSEVRRIRRSNLSIGVNGEQVFNPQGVWSKGPANIKNFDPATGSTYRYEKTKTGLRVINSELNVATWRTVPGQRNVYTGESIVLSNGTDVTPVDMKTWKLTQTGPDSMILIANGAVKYLVRTN